MYNPFDFLRDNNLKLPKDIVLAEEYLDLTENYYKSTTDDIPFEEMYFDGYDFYEDM